MGRYDKREGNVGFDTGFTLKDSVDALRPAGPRPGTGPLETGSSPGTSWGELSPHEQGKALHIAKQGNFTQGQTGPESYGNVGTTFGGQTGGTPDAGSAFGVPDYPHQGESVEEMNARKAGLADFSARAKTWRESHEVPSSRDFDAPSHKGIPNPYYSGPDAAASQTASSDLLDGGTAATVRISPVAERGIPNYDPQMQGRGDTSTPVVKKITPVGETPSAPVTTAQTPTAGSGALSSSRILPTSARHPVHPSETHLEDRGGTLGARPTPVTDVVSATGPPRDRFSRIPVPPQAREDHSWLGEPEGLRLRDQLAGRPYEVSATPDVGGNVQSSPMLGDDGKIILPSHIRKKLEDMHPNMAAAERAKIEKAANRVANTRDAPGHYSAMGYSPEEVQQIQDLQSKNLAQIKAKRVQDIKDKRAKAKAQRQKNPQAPAQDQGQLNFNTGGVQGNTTTDFEGGYRDPMA